MKIIVIGAGPGGYETALDAAKRGIETILIESGHVGGTCLNHGCIPTKALCCSAELLENLRKASEFGINAGEVSYDFSKVMERKNNVVSQLRSGVEGLLKNKLITLVNGRAVLKDAHTVTVEPVQGAAEASGPQEYSADYIIIATGSSSASIPIPGTDLPGVMTSNEILELDAVPQRLCIIGAGVIGLEFASVFRSFGSEVTVVEYCREILPRFDTDLAKRLKQSLGKRGIEIMTSAAVKGIYEASASDLAEAGIEQASGLLKVEYERKGALTAVLADKVLMAVGRRANVEGLGLEAAGVEYTPKGIKVNEFMQTTCPSVYAIGDVNGKMMLAHAATFQGRKALDHICGEDNEIDLAIMPAAVFTMPEAATVGLTEDDCKDRGIPCKCFKSFFRANGKAVCVGETDGFCKLVVAAPAAEACCDDGSSADGNAPYSSCIIRPGRILGCHLYGPHAADLVQEICALMNRNATLEDFKAVIHAHPTLGEVVQAAAN